VGYINITCICGHTADLGEFCRTLVYGDLPAGHFQCPGCGIAWKRHESEHRILQSGSAATIIPGRVELVPVAGRL